MHYPDYSCPSLSYLPSSPVLPVSSILIYFPYSRLVVLFCDPLSLARTIHVTMGFELLEAGRLTTPMGTQLKTMSPHQLDSASREEKGCIGPIPRL